MVDNPIIPQAYAPNPLVPGSAAQPVEEPNPTEPQVMVGSDGKIYTVPGTSYNIAIKNGWRPATPHEINKEQKIQDLVEYHETRPFDTMADIGSETSDIPKMFQLADTEQGRKAGTRTWGVAEPGGSPDPAQQPNDPELEEIKKEAYNRWSDKHPVLSTVGKAAGYIGNPLNLIGGGETKPIVEAAGKQLLERGGEALAERGIEKAAIETSEDLAAQGVKAAADKSLTSKVLTNAAKYAGMGAIYASPQNAIEAIYGDPNTAAENMLWATGLSGALGAGAELLHAGVAKTSDAVSNFARAPAILEETHNQLDKLVESGKVKSPNTADMLKEIHQGLPLAEMLTDVNAEKQKFMDNIISKIQAEGIEPGFAKTAKLIESVKIIGAKASDSSEKALATNAAEIMTTHLDTSVNQAFIAGDMADKVPDYSAARTAAYWTEKADQTLQKYGASTAAKGAAIAMASHMAGPIGAMGASYVLDKFIKNETLGAGSGYLRKIVDNVGGLMAKDSNIALAKYMDKIPAILSGKVVIPRTVVGIQHMIGKTSGLSNDQQYDKLVSSINRAATDIESTAHKVGAIAAVFSAHGDLAHLVAQKQFAAIAYLQSQIPKNPNAPRPFQKDDWKPSMQQKQEFLQKVAVVNDPQIVWSHFQAGVMTKIDRDTLKAVYPTIYDQMVQKIVQTAYDPRNPPLDHNKRMKLSMFTGVPLDASLKNINSIQSAVAMPSAPQAPTKKQANPRPSRAPKFEHAPSLQTSTQRLEYK